MKLQDIGFYTLCDNRAKYINAKSPMWRCEMIVTPQCNFKCPYCRGHQAFSRDCSEDMKLKDALFVLNQWISQGLKNVRFSGGEPTLYPHLNTLVSFAKDGGVEHIAISSNGSQSIDVYNKLIDCGVNDFSISLDACCAAFGDKMAGVSGKWETVARNIKAIAKRTYVTVGVVLTEETAETVRDIILFAHDLGVADIRIISAAQYDKLLKGLENIPQYIQDAHPILKYRINNTFNGRNVRGIKETDSKLCYLTMDDSVVAGKWHFPCVIYMREGGQPIGEIGTNMREDRVRWSLKHNSFLDPICQKNCLDVCIDFNNKCRSFRNTTDVSSSEALQSVMIEP